MRRTVPTHMDSEQATSKTRKNVSRACDQCRKRRVKCDGQEPCSSCQKNPRATCNFDHSAASGDLRRVRHTAQHYKKLQQYEKSVNELFDLVRQGRADGILEKIKNGADLVELAHVLSQNPGCPIPCQGQDRRRSRSQSSNCSDRRTSNHNHTPKHGERFSSDIMTQLDRKSSLAGKHFSETPSSITSGPDPADSASSSVNGSGTPQHSINALFVVENTTGIGHQDQTDHPTSTDPQRDRLPITSHNYTGIGSHSRTAEQVWTSVIQHHAKRQLDHIDLPCFSCDPFIVSTDDPISRAILSFRDATRRSIFDRTSNIDDMLRTSTPELDLLFRPRRESDSHAVWPWACEFAKTFTSFSLSLQLATVYLAAIQMRFSIHPCKETFNDLPPFLRPFKEQYSIPHAIGADVCHLPPLKQHLLTHWDGYERLLQATPSCNWPYSDAACLMYDERLGSTTLSRVFLEHITNLNNYSVGASMLEYVPELATFVRDEG